MPSSYRLRKTRHYPLPKTFENAWMMQVYSINGDTVPYPLAFHDEGKGSPSSKYTHPEHASFAEDNSPSVYPDSFLAKFRSLWTISLTKTALEIDKLPAVKFGLQFTAIAFKEKYEAKDEKSTHTIEDILELAMDSTDRYGRPLYNGTKVTEAWSGSADLAADVPGLTTSQQMEYDDFSIDEFYDTIQYKTNGPQLMKVQSGIRWYTLTRRHPTAMIKAHLKSRAKRSNPYMLWKGRIILPQASTHRQLVRTSDSTLGNDTLLVNVTTRGLEWNDDFIHRKL
jgi:hypothetical protein